MSDDWRYTGSVSVGNARKDLRAVLQDLHKHGFPLWVRANGDFLDVYVGKKQVQGTLPWRTGPPEEMKMVQLARGRLEEVNRGGGESRTLDNYLEAANVTPIEAFFPATEKRLKE
jgi:hypothetical protein